MLFFAKIQQVLGCKANTFYRYSIDIAYFASMGRQIQNVELHCADIKVPLIFQSEGEHTPNFSLTSVILMHLLRQMTCTQVAFLHHNIG